MTPAGSRPRGVGRAGDLNQEMVGIELRGSDFLAMIQCWLFSPAANRSRERGFAPGVARRNGNAGADIKMQTGVLAPALVKDVPEITRLRPP